ncbi:MAG: family 10 glycosylhydrolase [bacterium]|nr:family 10 glycosylhydrolase [bacterium]
MGSEAQKRPNEPFTLSEAHHAAVNRRRRVVVQFDAHTEMGTDIDDWIAYRFDYADEPGSQIDSVWWDIGALGYAVYPSKVLDPFPHEGLQRWRDQGVDWVARLFQASHDRGLETFWHHRISEVELVTRGVGADRKKPHPLKQEHPDWVLDTWWNHGLWNLAVPEVRAFKVRVLREVAENYPVDGIQIDFARHIPCLPPGQQWEHRDCVTDLMRSLRAMTLEVEKQRGRPFLLATKVPRTLEGCKVDGFDVETWAREDLVDILTIGTRAMEVDIESFRRITAGHNIKLQPCFDDHHTTDAYQYASIEYLRGVFTNWWKQGADSVYTFNWSQARPEVCERMGALAGPPSHRQAYHEIGSRDTMRFRDKAFAVDRRGGYPWSEGYFGRNDTAQLPVVLETPGESVPIRIHVGDAVRAHNETVESVTLRLVLFGAKETDNVQARLNGVPLTESLRDPEWKDKLIFSPKPQPASGGADYLKVDPNQRLLRIEYAVDPHACRLGENQVDLQLAKGSGKLQVEKVEIHVRYPS